MSNEGHDTQPRMDPANLYREELFTDRRVGTIRVLTPVTKEGRTDTTRKVLYVAETQVLTPGGMLPISFEIEASSLAEAIEKFGDGVQQAVEETIREIQALRREAASSIVVPDVKPGLLTGPGGPGGPTGPGRGQRGGIIHRP
jgi:hypothetical protein